MPQQSSKHIPERSCVGCRAKQAKRRLVRLVRTVDGTFAVEKTHEKLSGRGAYLCADVQCLEKAIKKNAFSHVYKQKLSREDMDNIKNGFVLRLVQLTQQL